MSISSMTGFARIEGQSENCNWVWEVRAVNGKGLDVRFRMPSFLSELEDVFRKSIRAAFARGNLQVSLQLDKTASDTPQIIVDTDLVRDVMRQFNPLIAESVLTPASVDGVLGMRGVLQTQLASLSLDEMKAPLEASFAELITALTHARLAEGKTTQNVLNLAIDRIEELVAEAKANPETTPKAILEKLQQQLAVLNETVAPERLAQEAAVLAIKADVMEELDRLSGHIEAARVLLNTEGPIGRKLEFLSQEFQREANTLCSKSNNAQLTDVGLALKTLIDQIREQAANVE